MSNFCPGQMATNYQLFEEARKQHGKIPRTTFEFKKFQSNPPFPACSARPFRASPPPVPGLYTLPRPPSIPSPSRPRFSLIRKIDHRGVRIRFLPPPVRGPGGAGPTPFVDFRSHFSTIFFFGSLVFFLFPVFSCCFLTT